MEAQQWWQNLCAFCKKVFVFTAQTTKKTERNKEEEKKKYDCKSHVWWCQTSKICLYALSSQNAKGQKKKKIVHLGEIYQAYQFGDSLDH